MAMSNSPSAPLPINLSQANRKPKGGLARMKQDALLSERSKSHTRALAAAEQHQLAHEAVLAAANAEAAAITAWTHRDRDVAFAEPTADDIIFVEKHTADEESAAPEQQQQEQPKKAEAPAAGAALELDVLKCDEPTEVPIEAPLTGRQMRLLEALQVRRRPLLCPRAAWAAGLSSNPTPSDPWNLDATPLCRLSELTPAFR
jgi:hypothetical protein